jgi:hypothetical protein
MGAIRDFEVAFNRFLDEEFATFEEVQAMVAHFQTLRVLNEKARRNAANREAEAQQQAEQERVEAEKTAHIQELLRQQRDNR